MLASLFINKFLVFGDIFNCFEIIRAIDQSAPNFKGTVMEIEKTLINIACVFPKNLQNFPFQLFIILQ